MAAIVKIHQSGEGLSLSTPANLVLVGRQKFPVAIVKPSEIESIVDELLRLFDMVGPGQPIDTRLLDLGYRLANSNHPGHSRLFRAPDSQLDANVFTRNYREFVSVIYS